MNCRDEQFPQSVFSPPAWVGLITSVKVCQIRRQRRQARTHFQSKATCWAVGPLLVLRPGWKVFVFFRGFSTLSAASSSLSPPAWIGPLPVLRAGRAVTSDVLFCGFGTLSAHPFLSVQCIFNRGKATELDEHFSQVRGSLCDWKMCFLNLLSQMNL